MELSAELDNKIALIRKKYAEYTQASIFSVKEARLRDEPRITNYLDENDIRLSDGLGLRKMVSDYEPISKSFGRSSVNGLGLRKLNSMRDAL